jgi:hypothetical protein
MNFLAYFRSVSAKFFRRSQFDSEMEEELRSHIRHRADDLERSGLNRAEAERRARIEFGGPGRFKEECHEAIGGNYRLRHQSEKTGDRLARIRCEQHCRPVFEESHQPGRRRDRSR